MKKVFGVVVAGTTVALASQFFKEPEVAQERKRVLPETYPSASVDQVQSLLTNNQKTLYPSQSLIHRCYTNAVASNDPIEDTHVESLLPRGVLLGIFDGHSGTECSAALAEYLSAYVADSINRIPNHSEPQERVAQVSDALRAAFVRLDDDLLKGGIPRYPISPSSSISDWLPFNFFGPRKLDKALFAQNLRPALAGSCCLVAYLEGSRLYIACTGDSRAVLGRRRQDGSHYALDLSADQTTKNPAEYARLLEEHPGEETTVVNRGRILGGLMPTRAFGLFFASVFTWIGDARYKWPLEVQQVLTPFGIRRIPQNYKTPPYVTARPEVTSLEIDLQSDDFLIMASDGLWDELSSEEAVNVVARHSQNEPATELIKEALSDGDPAQLQRILGIPAPKSRRYRDDITVSIAFFGDQEMDAVPKDSGQFSKVDLSKAQAKKDNLSSWVQMLKNARSSKL